jgi:hypothetical protein
LKFDGEVWLAGMAVKLIGWPNWGFEGDQEKSTDICWDGLTLQAVRGCISHPLKECQASPIWSGSQ